MKLVLALILCWPCLGASRFWVGGGSSTNWNATGNTNWSATSGGTGNAAVPTSADDVTFDGNSGALAANISAAITVKSVTVTSGYTGTWTQAAVTLSVAGTLQLGANMVYSPSADTQAITITGTGNVTTAAHALGNFTVNGSGITVTLQDTLTLRANTTTLTVTQGTLNLGGNTATIGHFVSTANNTRALNATNSTINIGGDGNTDWNTGTNTANLTLTMTNSTVAFTGGFPTFATGGKTFHNFTWIGSSSINQFANFTLTGAATFDSITITCSQCTQGSDSIIFPASTVITVTTALSITGSPAKNRMLIQSSLKGTAATINNTGATVSATQADWEDITLQSAVDLSATNCGNAGGNSGITFTAPVTNYWVGAGGGNWTDVTHWASTSGGAGGTGRVPLPQDNVIVDASSGVTGSDVITVDNQFAGFAITWSGIPAGLKWNMADGSGVGKRYLGSVALSAGMTVSGNDRVYLECRALCTLTTNGVVMANLGIRFMAPSSTVQLADDLNTTNTDLILSIGTFDANGHNITVALWWSDINEVTVPATSPRTFIMGPNINITGTGGVWNDSIPTGYTVVPGSGQITISDTSSNSKTATFAGVTYPSLVITGGGTGTVTIKGGNTFADLTIGSPKTVIFTSGTTNTITGTVNCTGTSSNVITIRSSAAGSAATISKSSGTVSCDWLSLKDSTATGGAKFYAGGNSTNVSGNTGWLFFFANQTFQGKVSITGALSLTGK